MQEKLLQAVYIAVVRLHAAVVATLPSTVLFETVVQNSNFGLLKPNGGTFVTHSHELRQRNEKLFSLRGSCVLCSMT